MSAEVNADQAAFDRELIEAGLVLPSGVPGVIGLSADLIDLRAQWVAHLGRAAAAERPAAGSLPPALPLANLPRTRALEAAGRLVDVPEDRALAIAGLDATPLPTPLLAAAATLLRLLPPADTTKKGKTP